MRAPGQVLAEKYRLIRELGRGGMGSVWCAEHLLLHSRVALKLIESTDSDRPDEAAQFLREARLAAGLNSQHVVQIFDYGLAEDTPFIAMELLEGETLRRRLERQQRLPLAEAQELLRQAARGVEKAHRAGIVHRDLKPENVFIVSGEDTEILKVLDFGLAKAPASALVESISPSTPTGAVLGTPHYMSPEQAMGSKTLDHRTDLWSLGVIAFECVTGQVPFRGETLGALIVALCSLPMPVPSERAAVPAGFDEWFARACARDPRERFSTARELVEHFSQLQAATGDAPAAELLGRGNTLPAVTPPAAPLAAAPLPGPGASAASGAPESVGPGTGKPTVRTLEDGAKSRGPRSLRVLAAVVGVLLLAGVALLSSSWRREPEEATRGLTAAPAGAQLPPPSSAPLVAPALQPSAPETQAPPPAAPPPQRDPAPPTPSKPGAAARKKPNKSKLSPADEIGF